MVVAPGGDVTVIDSGIPLTFALGIGEWVVTDAVAASGGELASGVAIDLILLETRHRLRIECDDDGFAARWVTEPLHTMPLAEMRMPR